MTRPYTVQEQQKNNWFRPNHRLAVLIGVTKFNAVVKLRKKRAPHVQQKHSQTEND